MHRRTVIGAALAAPALLGSAAQAQTRLRWAHVYETNEPYHTQAVWAAQQIQQRTNNRWAIEVFPASALGNEPTINQGLALGTVDMIYTGVAFAGATYKPIAITNAPYALRDFDHFMAYRRSDLLQDMMGGYNRQTGNQALALTYYGERHVTANRSIMKPEDMRGMKLRVPQAPLFLMFTRSVGANATPIAFAEVYLALQQGTVDGQENPLPTIQAKKFYEVQTHISLTGHITESLLTILSGSTWRRLNDADKQTFTQVLKEASDRATNEIRQAELALPPWFEGQGKTVQRPDREAFRAAALPLHNDAAAGAGWTREQYDRLQAIR
ncbi:sialic acid TRAP transporter substrate-binding protein SiaP [Neoroseomonas oryzicola]|uniref:DctP family TRAP transporter solute-binding subunit n=1 Tax=Neoroseomonas oryzicola TaxID=535904 RepID=A0A9X9WLW1_9PROT|nr:sialic acid TRAP transporter substrate-binding protein SiaP [Neoroseomonas oryzicola]MBR0661321.1 DctP family TRAP transporter solute-binding subunit [Neoroseomonas oryzicola]NKE18811.1 DctP family TRAP transporter solute-binding subunit [Neoroseomonas oryzicola]